MPRGGKRIAGPGKTVGRPPGMPNPEAGRKPISKRLKLGDQFYASRQTPDGSYGEGLWTVSEVGRGKLVFKCASETITLIN